METDNVQYVLTLSSNQAHEVMKAVELLMRLKINQPSEIIRSVLDGDEMLDVDTFCKRRDLAKPLLESAFLHLFPTPEDIKKDNEWYRLYNLYQVIRYALHTEENPDSTGVDSRPPMRFTDEPLPGLKIEHADNNSGSKREPASFNYNKERIRLECNRIREAANYIDYRASRALNTGTEKDAKLMQDFYEGVSKACNSLEKASLIGIS